MIELRQSNIANRNKTTKERVNNSIIKQWANYPINTTNKKGKACLPDNKLNFSAEVDPTREPISNACNLMKGSRHRSYTLWRKGLNGLSFNSQSLESGFAKRERKGGLLMHVSIPTILLSLSSFLSGLSFFSL